MRTFCFCNVPCKYLGIHFFLMACFVAAFSLCPERLAAKPNALGILPSAITFSEYFPCARCHRDGTVQDNKDGRMHKTIPLQGHPGKKYDCFSCHDRGDFDKLRLFDGSRIELKDSSRLCGQCHSTNYGLWQSGLHGKIKGTWNGERKIIACVQCHDPHDPVFAAQNPKPPPTPPENTLRWRK